MKETRGIEYDPEDFPNYRDSPDPEEMIETLCDCGGVVSDAADELTCSEKTIYRWASKYEPINQAIEQNRTAIAYESRETLVELMREADDRTRYKAAVKLATMYDDRLDWSRRERREITKKEVSEEVEKSLEDAGVDELLDKYNELTGE